MNSVRSFVSLSTVFLIFAFSPPVKADSDISLMIVGDADDNSFNELAVLGLQKAAEEFTFDSQVVAIAKPISSIFGRMTSAVNSFQSELVIGNGFPFSESIVRSALRYPDVEFAILDFPANLFLDPPLPNLWSSDFAVEAPSFLAGYLAAASSLSGIVATYGGLPIPPVLRFMEGLKQGVACFNDCASCGSCEACGLSNPQNAVTVLETFAPPEEPFAFESGLAIGTQFLQQGADRILPVAGAGLFGVLEALLTLDPGGNARMIGVDSDIALLVPQFAGLFLTSVIKNIDVAVVDAVTWALQGGEPGRVYIGTLENGGTGLAPLNSEVASHQATVDCLEQRIKDGDIVITLPF